MLHVEVGRLVSNNDDFAIVSHTSPDGDSMGSILGLYNALRDIGKNVDVFCEAPLPDKYSFLPGFDKIITSNMPESYRCLFVLDCGDIERLGEFRELISRSEVIVNIDHHISNNLFGNINIVDTNSSSTGELIYQILKINGMEITRDISICLYTSILTDTGGFKYSNTTSMTFSIAGDLINSGIDFPEINRSLYNKRTVGQVKLMSIVTSSLEMYSSNKISMITLDKKTLHKCKCNEDEAEEFVNIARDIEGVEVAIFIKEKGDNLYKVSLRSNNYADVRKIAEAFNGGGHIRAAGCTIQGDINYVKECVISEANKQLDVNI